MTTVDLKLNREVISLPVTALTRVLPYALLTFIGIAGWTMESTALLAIVVLGTVGVAIGTSIGASKQTTPKS